MGNGGDMLNFASMALMSAVVGFACWKGGRAERLMALTIFVSWLIFVGLVWAGIKPPDVAFAVSDLVTTVGMAGCSHAEADKETRRWIGAIMLLAALSMLSSGAGHLLQAMGAGPSAYSVSLVNNLLSVAILAFLVLATLRRMKRNAIMQGKLKPDDGAFPFGSPRPQLN